jgi:WD40 repeat protein
LANLGHDDSIRAVTFSPDGKTIATGSVDKTIKLWQVETGDLIKTLSDSSNSSEYINSVAFNSDGKILVSADEDKTIKLWNVNQGKVIRTLSASSAGVNSAIFTNGDRTIISGSAAEDNKLRIWQESN